MRHFLPTYTVFSGGEGSAARDPCHVIAPTLKSKFSAPYPSPVPPPAKCPPLKSLPKHGSMADMSFAVPPPTRPREMGRLVTPVRAPKAVFSGLQSSRVCSEGTSGDKGSNQGGKENVSPTGKCNAGGAEGPSEGRPSASPEETKGQQKDVRNAKTERRRKIEGEGRPGYRPSARRVFETMLVERPESLRRVNS